MQIAKAFKTAPMIPHKLQEYGSLVRENLERYLPDREPRHHLYDLVSDYPRRGGKMMRPSVCIATTRAFGGELGDALQTATSIELLHNALLVHDDIQDGSAERRGKPTMHKLHGIPLALNVGSTMALLSLKPLVDNMQNLGPGLTMRILEETRRVAQESAEGQAMELGWCRDNTMDLVDAHYLEMVLKKTCWLAMIYPSRVGALIGSRGRAQVDNLVRFGFFVGAAFQIQDDVLNLIGDHAQYGKELGGDLWEGKRSLILIHLFNECTLAEREAVKDILQTPRDSKTRRQVERLSQLVERYGCVDYARQAAFALAGAAQHEFDLAYGHLPASQDKDFLGGLTRWVFEQN